MIDVTVTGVTILTATGATVVTLASVTDVTEECLRIPVVLV